ncbi:unnamed protein product [Diamesa hyperborea]
MLFIHKTSVNFIPENIGLLFNLKGFAMRFCELKQIRSKDFYGMNHVEFMDLGVNSLTVLPSNAFSALPNLLSIDLSYNQIEELPKSLFCNNVKLIIPLVVMMILLAALSDAENLDCSFESFLYIFSDSSTFYTCKVNAFENGKNDKIITGYNGEHVDSNEESDVKMIYMKDLDVEFIPENIGLLFKLTALCMSECKIVQIRPNDFKGMEDLEYLDLGGNQLLVIPTNALYSLKSLIYIDLSYNQIEELSNGAFSNNHDLVRTHLVENKIKLIGSTVFDEMSEFAAVNLKDNICVSKHYHDIKELKKDAEMYCKVPDDFTCTFED